MPTYLVTYPIVGIASVEVEAENEEAAVEKGMEMVTYDDIQEWEAVRRISSGNVLHASQNAVDVKQIGD